MPVVRSVFASRAASTTSATSSSLPSARASALPIATMRSVRVELAAELRLERAPAEVLDRDRASGRLLVLLEEEPRVGEPRAQHALVAVARDLRVLHRRAGDRDEAVLEPALPVHHREVALVVPHLRDDHLGRQVEVRLLELAGHAGRVLDEVEHLLDERLVGPEAPARRLRRLRELLLESRAPLGRVHEHLALRSFAT